MHVANCSSSIGWAAPEVLKATPKFSEKSDVWSFGVMVWELMNNGEDPWHRRVVFESEVMFMRKEHLPRPSQCPLCVWELISRCCDDDPERRPTFSQVHEELFRLLPSLSEE